MLLVCLIVLLFLLLRFWPLETLSPTTVVFFQTEVIRVPTVIGHLGKIMTTIVSSVGIAINIFQTLFVFFFANVACSSIEYVLWTWDQRRTLLWSNISSVAIPPLELSIFPFLSGYLVSHRDLSLALLVPPWGLSGFTSPPPPMLLLASNNDSLVAKTDPGTFCEAKLQNVFVQIDKCIRPNC